MKRLLLSLCIIAIVGVLSFLIWNRSQQAQTDWMIAWTKSLVLARVDTLLAGEISAQSVERQAGADSWAIGGRIAIATVTGESSRQPYTAVIRKACTNYIEQSCWELLSLTIAGKAVLPPGTSMQATTWSSPALPAALPAASPATAVAAPAPIAMTNQAAAKTEPEPAPAAPDRIAAPLETAAGPDMPPIPAPAPRTEDHADVHAPAASKPAVVAALNHRPQPRGGDAGEASQHYRSLVFLIQSRLTLLGYEPGRKDGYMSDETSAAIAAYQRSHDLPADGQPSNHLLDHMERALLGREQEAARSPRPSTGIAAAARAEAYGHFRKAYEASEQGRPDRAIDHYTRAMQAGGLSQEDYIHALNNRGTAYADKGLYDLAIKDYDRAIRLNPTYAAAYNNRCSSYHRKELYDRAIEDCNKAIRLKPDYAAAYNNRGSAYHHQKLYRLAVRDYDAAIRLEPTYDYAYFNRGGIYQSEGELARAIADFKKAYSLAPDNADYRAKLQELGLAE